MQARQSKLTCANYFSVEMQNDYMSASQFNAFDRCEAAALAELRGLYRTEPTTPMLVGSFVDAHFSGEMEQFMYDNPQCFTRNGELRSEYKRAVQIIKRIERDELFMRYMSGEKQRIVTSKIAGVPFKCKIDSYHQDKAIVDLKIVKDFTPIYVPQKGRMNFVEAWGCDIQGAIYQAIEGNRLPFYIAAATKEIEPDIAIIQLDQITLDLAMDYVLERVHRFADIKKGLIEPVRCERCDYCKSTKKLTTILSLEDLDEVN